MHVVPAPSFDPSALRPNNRTLDRNLFFQATDYESYATNLDLTGKLDLWGTPHEVLVGFDYYRLSNEYRASGDFQNGDPALAIDIFNPTYGVVDPVLFREELLPFPFFDKTKEDWYGVYFQDHLTLWNKLHILGGDRYDWATTGGGSSSLSFAEAEAAIRERKDEEFSPRVGLLYQPWSWLGVYGNWAQSFGTNNGISATGETLPPQTGEQYEAGIKTELFDQRLTATLAFYHLTNQNILTPDFSTPSLTDSAPIGEARSQGIELDAAGQITENLSVIGNYAFTDARVTKDFAGLQGKRLENVPEHSGSLWLRYDVNGAGTDGFTFRFGVFAAGQREGDANNTFQLPGYARLDALAAYRWKLGPSRVTAQLNIRNLLDKEYFESSDPFANVHPRLSVFPGAPLTAIGSVRVEFW